MLDDVDENTAWTIRRRYSNEIVSAIPSPLGDKKRTGGLSIKDGPNRFAIINAHVGSLVEDEASTPPHMWQGRAVSWCQHGNAIFSRFTGLLEANGGIIVPWSDTAGVDVNGTNGRGVSQWA